jgi:non-ribosomal peptide synthetase component F
LPNNSVITIGKTLPNYLSYILDKHLQPVPIGVPGELYVGGVGLARGYFGDAQQTQAKFVPNPFFSLLPLDNAQRAFFGNRIYRTGDLVRYLPNGEMEYIGRTDFQVKLRGLRIELGEIETAISQFEGVRQVVAMVVDGQQENKLLVAYVVPQVFAPLYPFSPVSHSLSPYYKIWCEL